MGRDDTLIPIAARMGGDFSELRTPEDMADSPEASIRISAVNKRFGSTHAVRDLDLEVPRGSLIGFLGPNGAGKSTTIRMIMSIIYPDSGSIEVLGSSALANKDRIGYLPEERGVYRKMKVADFLVYIARLKGAESSNLRKTVYEWLERIELPDVATKKCEELSKGMQQKVQFLASIIHDPDLIILDEPFSGLDPVNAELINHFVRDLHQQGKTIIFSTHVLHQAEQLCDRIFLINKGVKLLDATIDEIHERFNPRTLTIEPLNGTAEVESIDGVRAIRPIHDSPALEVEIDPAADPQSLMQQILSASPMRSVAMRRLSLEEVFIQMVIRESGDEAAELAREELSHV